MNMLPLPPYPMDAFHCLTRNAARDVQATIKAPDALIASSFLTAMSIACQSEVDVELPSGQIRPVSLNILTIADSGERKTSTDMLVAAPIYAHDKAVAASYKVEMARYVEDYRCWKMIEKAIERELAKAVSRNEDLEPHKDAMRAHIAKMPKKPERARLLYQSVTERPIMGALDGDGKSIAIVSDEGEIVLKGGAMANIGLLNKAWDGAALITFDRADETIEVTNPRVTVSFMVQSEVFDAFLESRGKTVRSSGHLARYLVSRPDSTQGFRLIPPWEQPRIYLPAFHERLTTLLCAGRSQGNEVKRKVLTFSPEAREHWIRTANYLEQQLVQGGRLASIRDFASKGMEIASRIAAVLHHFNNEEGAITYDTLIRAIQIAQWHLDEFLRLFGDSADVPQVQRDAAAVFTYLHKKYYTFGLMSAYRHDVSKNGPVRHCGRFNVALMHLAQAGAVYLPETGKQKRTIWLQQQAFGGTTAH